MKIFIQSKSGNFNSVISVFESLESCFNYLKEAGAYGSTYRGKVVLVPFDEIEFIREAADE